MPPRNKSYYKQIRISGRAMVWKNKKTKDKRKTLKKPMVGNCKKRIYLLTVSVAESRWCKHGSSIGGLDVFPFETATLSAANFLIF